MISIAITGGIGSGKTYVSTLLQQRGIPIYNADIEAKRLMASDSDIRKDLIALLGDEVYQGGELNKPFLAGYLFSSPEHVQQINAIVHPRVKADFYRWVKARENFAFVGIESAILFEAGFQDYVDYVVMVYAPEALRLERAMKRDAASEQQIRDRMAAQMDEEQKRNKSHFVILNDGSSSLDTNLQSCWKS